MRFLNTSTHKLIPLLLVIAVCSVSTTGQQLYDFYEPGDWVTFTNFRYVTDIARGFNTVYFGTTNGILQYDFIGERWLDPITVSDGMPEDRVISMAVDRLTDEIWVRTPSFTSYYNSTFNDWYTNEPFPEDKVQRSAVSPRDLPQMFVNRGYSYFPGGRLLGRDNLEYEITETLRDDSGVFWFGVWGVGPGIGDLRRNSLDLMPFGPYDSDVAAIAVDGKDLWILGGGEGLPGVISRYDRDRDIWTYDEPRFNSRIQSDQFYVINHDDNRVMMGTEYGLVVYDKKKERYESYTPSDGIVGERVTAVLAVRDNILVGTDRGMSVVDLKRDSVYWASDDLMMNRVILDFAVHERTVFAATDDGLLSLKWGTGRWNRFLPEEPALSGVVFDIAVQDSLLYVCSDDGVTIYDLLNADYRFYDRNTVFKNADLRVLLVHEGVVWVAGDNGAFRLNERTDNWYHYQVEDGLVSDRVRALAGDGDFVWLGTDRGATRFYWDDRMRRDWLE
jgi:hypothetical protein